MSSMSKWVPSNGNGMITMIRSTSSALLIHTAYHMGNFDYYHPKIKKSTALTKKVWE